MPKITFCHKNEDAATVYTARVRDICHRLNDLRVTVAARAMEEPNRENIALMDYLLKSLDNLIHGAEKIGL